MGTYRGIIYCLKAKVHCNGYKNGKVTSRRSGIVNLIAKYNTVDGLRENYSIPILHQLGLSKSKTDWVVMSVEILREIETNKPKI